MKKYAVYDNKGNILRWGTCPTIDLGIQAKDGESVVEIGTLERELDITHKVNLTTKALHRISVSESEV